MAKYLPMLRGRLSRSILGWSSGHSPTKHSIACGLAVMGLLILSVSAAMAETVDSVNTLADLKAQTVPGYMRCIFMKYRTQPGDNGGGMFLWNSASTRTPDDALVVRPNGHSGAGRWERKHDGYVYPSWFGALGNGINDDNAALQAAMDTGGVVKFDKNYYTVAPVAINRMHMTVDFSGFSLIGISETPQDAVLWIMQRYLTLRNISVDANFKPYNTAVHWYSASSGAPAQYIRVYGLTISNAQIGLLFGSHFDNPNPLDVPQSENFIYDIRFRAVHNCIQAYQPNGFLFISGGVIDCDPYEWTTGFDLAASRCINNKGCALVISNCKFVKSAQSGYAFEGSSSLSNCRIECNSNWFVNGGVSLTNCTGLMANDSASIFTVLTGGAGGGVVSGCDFARSPGIAGYSGQYLINAPSAPTSDFTIGDSTFTEWKQSYLTNGNARIRMSASRFPTDSGSRQESELRFLTGCLVKTGTGSPEGVVAAPVGSIYLRADGSSGTCIYSKQSGSATTGWVAK